MPKIRLCFCALILTFLITHSQARADHYGLVVMYSDLEPYIISKDKEISGFLVPYMNRVATAANIEIHWRNVPWENQLPALKRNQPNVCAIGLFKTPERETYSKFTHPIGTDKGFVLVSAKGNTALTTHQYFKSVLADRTLKPILQEDTVYNPYVNKLLSGKNFPRTQGSVSRMLRMLAQNSADYIILTPVMAKALLAKSGLSSQITIYNHFKDLKETSAYYMACSLSTDTQLWGRLNKAIALAGPLAK